MMLFKEIVDGRTHGRTHGRTPDIEGSQKLTEHFVLRWANKREKAEVILEMQLINNELQEVY